jgi:N-acylneuraminate cytidylyltransferase
LRSAENSDDFATTSDVLLEVLNYLSKEGRLVDAACCIYPTSVLLQTEDLIRAHKQFTSSQAPVLLACVPYSHPVQRGFVIRNGQVKLQFPEYIHTRSQDLEQVFHDTGSFYFFRVANFIEQKTLWQENITPFVLDERKIQDIDTEEDWLLAELKFKLRENEEL